MFQLTKIVRHFYGAYTSLLAWKLWRLAWQETAVEVVGLKTIDAATSINADGAVCKFEVEAARNLCECPTWFSPVCWKMVSFRGLWSGLPTNLFRARTVDFLMRFFAQEAEKLFVGGVPNYVTRDCCREIKGVEAWGFDPHEHDLLFVVIETLV